MQGDTVRKTVSSLTRPLGHPSPHRARAACLAVLATVAGLLAAPAALASPVPARAASQAAARAAAPALEDAQTLAAEQARRTGKPVTVSSLTTPTSVTHALPDGRFELTTSAAPVRAWAGAGWHALDAALRRNRDGTWSPTLAPSAVTVSG